MTLAWNESAREAVLRLLVLCCALAVGSFGTGCAALKPPPREVRTTGYLVGSTPNGATVKVDGVEKGLTPVILQMPMNKGFEVEVALAGYQTFREKVESKTDWKHLGQRTPMFLFQASAMLAMSYASNGALGHGGSGSGSAPSGERPCLMFVPSHTLVTLIPLPSPEHPSKVEKAP